MIWFKTRHEVNKLRGELADLREMLRAHFDIKYTMQDFQKWCDGHPDRQKEIPVSVGEFLRYYQSLDPSVKVMYYRGLKLKPRHTKVNTHVE